MILDKQKMIYILCEKLKKSKEAFIFSLKTENTFKKFVLPVDDLNRQKMKSCYNHSLCINVKS